LLLVIYLSFVPTLVKYPTAKHINHFKLTMKNGADILQMIAYVKYLFYIYVAKVEDLAKKKSKLPWQSNPAWAGPNSRCANFVLWGILNVRRNDNEI